MIKLMRPYVGKEELELISQVLESGNLVEGQMVDMFEKETCEWIGAKHGIACTSATTGLELALRAMDIGAGDEVIVPGFTHPATALCVITTGAKPVMVDVDQETYNTNAGLIKKAITKRTKAIMPVSLFGRPLDIEPIIDLGIPVIEDAACSLGSELNGVRVGSQCTTVFSFHPRKVFTTGDGGLVVTNDTKLSERIRRIKKFGAFKEWGTNYRMSDILGAIALAQIRRIDQVVKDRKEKAAIYDDLLNIKTSGGNYQSYVIKIDNRDNVMRAMIQDGIECQVGTYALHTLEVFKGQAKLPVSQKLHDSLLTLPLHFELSLQEQIFIIKKLQEHGKTNFS